MPGASTTIAALAAFAGGLLLTLVLAARLTPRVWWRRANARALAVLLCGTVLLGGMLHAILRPDTAAHARTRALPPLGVLAEAPVAGAQYRVRDYLNLREHTGINARRLAVVPAGARVTATGLHRGDWWQISAVVDGRRVDGWASSLWLRRTDETGGTRASGVF